MKAPRPIELTKLMLWGRRAPLDRTPADVGLSYEDVQFRAAVDGLGLRGWFIPREDDEPGPVVVFMHGWLWNRLGNQGGQIPVADKDVDFVPSARALHDAGYHVLLFDLRNHGESASNPPITYGPVEARDYAGAINYVRSRRDVDSTRIGALACSMGANAALYGTPTCQPVKAILAVQPAVLAHFNGNFARTEFGRLGPAMLKPVDPLYRLMGRPMPRDHNPAIPARDLGDTVVQYVQGTGDPWGRMEDVEAMAAATPNALPVVRFPSTGRYEGYRYVNEAVDDVAGFFREHL
jgi:uncharacterized protein